MHDEHLTPKVEELLTAVRDQMGREPLDHMAFYLEGLTKLLEVRQWTRSLDDYMASEELSLARKSS